MLHVSPMPNGVPGLFNPGCSAPRPSRRSAIADPIEAAIAAHRAAYDAFQVAPDGEPSENAQIAYCEASEALVASYSTTRFGALTLFEHLRWWIADEVESAHAYQPAYRIAQARVAELALFLGDGLSAPRRAAAAR